MSIVTTDSSNYAGIADAIRAKGVQGTFKPREMAAAIEGIAAGAAEIADGMVITARDADGNPTAVTIYGSAIKPYTCGANVARTYKWFGNTVTDISFVNQVTELMPMAFYNALGSGTDISFPDLVTVGNKAFYGSAFCSVTLPPSSVLGSEVFRASSITSISVQSARTEASSSSTFRQWTGANAVCGSVGNPWIVHSNTFVGASNAAYIVIFCGGADVDSNLAAIRNGAINATITVRASKATVYGGASYSAGDIMITSTVEV